MAEYIKSYRLQLTGSAQPLSSTKITTQALSVRNEDGNDAFYSGDSTVSTAQGYPYYSKEALELEARTTARGIILQFDLSKIYIIGTASQYVRVQYLVDE
jgi:hypothetical protein